MDITLCEWYFFISGAGLVTPSHVNLELWASGKEDQLNKYANDIENMGPQEMIGRCVRATRLRSSPPSAR